MLALLGLAGCTGGPEAESTPTRTATAPPDTPSATPAVGTASPTPSPSPTSTPEPTETATSRYTTQAPTDTETATATPTRTDTSTATDSPTPTTTPSPTETPTPTETPSPTATPTETPTATPTYDLEVVVGPDGGLSFSPSSFDISTGDTVRWTWDSGGHNVKPSSTPSGSDWAGTPGDEFDTFSGGHTYQHTFDVAGDYEYYCAPHRSAGMTGSFTVG